MMIAILMAYWVAVSVYNEIVHFLMIPTNFNHFPRHCRKDVQLYSIALAEKYNESEKDTSYLGYGRIQYVSLTMVRKENISEATSGDLMMATVVGGANKVIEKREPIEFDDLFKPVSEKRLKFILITGTPGIGKSTLAMEIARSSPTEHHSLAILIRLREGNVEGTNDLFSKKGLDHIDIANVKSCIGHTKGKGVLWIVDGFDELPLREQRNKESIIHQLIQNEIYSGSTIVITTRAVSTTLFTEYLKNKSNSKHVEIVGFSDSQIKRYVSQRFEGKNNTALRSNFYTYYGTNPMIQAMMSIPLNAAIITSLYEYRFTHSSSSNLRPIPHTQTGLYSALVTQVLQRHQLMRYQSLELIDGLMTRLDIEKLPLELQIKFINLTKIAYMGIVRDVYVFNDSDLFTQFDLRNHSDFDHLDLMNKVTSRRTDGSSVPRYTYHFLHTTLQEYLAAVYYLYASNHTYALEQPAKLGVFLFGISSVLQTVENEKVNYTLLSQIADYSYRNISNCFYFYEFPQLQFSDREHMKIYFHLMNWFFAASDMHSNAFKCGYLLANYKSMLASKIMLADGTSTRMFVLGLTSNSSHSRMDDVLILGKIKDLNFFCNVNFNIADMIKLVSIAKPDKLSLFVRDAQCAKLISNINYQPKHRLSIGVDPELIKEAVQEIAISKVKLTLFTTVSLTADLLTCPNISTLALITNPNVSRPHCINLNETETNLLSSTTTIKSVILNNYHLSRKGLRALLSVKNSVYGIALGVLILQPEKSFYRSYWCLLLESLFNPVTTTYLSIRMTSPDIPEPLVQHPAELMPLSVLLWHPVKDLLIAFTMPKTCYVLEVVIDWFDTHVWDYFMDFMLALNKQNYFANHIRLTINFPILLEKPTEYVKTIADLLSDFLLLLAEFVENSKQPLIGIDLVMDYNDTELLLTMKPDNLEHFEKLLKASLSKPYVFDVLIGHHDSHS